ncbi:MAG: uridine phosphorylase [Candidatus Bipolaricaulota bacterium]|nr:uridine phosphorylase [Candidatus Bipolaricaulota bacterium]MDW8030841.1 uridine phosphorylase [Candidatus Bipolaricaulota bacterium]
MPRLYHLGLSEREIAGAQIALLPGDPARVEKIARMAERGRFVASHREFCTWLGHIKDRPVVITSTGIGGPSTAIAVEELAQLGVRIFLRVGTTGALQHHINMGDVVITTGAVRLDGASAHYAPIEYPAVADYNLVWALVEAAQRLKIPYHVGVTCSSATFYPGQERSDSFSQYIIRDLRGTKSEWQRLGVLNYEMEAATLLTMCSTLGLRAGCVCGVVDTPTQEQITPESLQRAEIHAIQVAVQATEIFLDKQL